MYILHSLQCLFFKPMQAILKVSVGSHPMGAIIITGVGVYPAWLPSYTLRGVPVNAWVCKHMFNTLHRCQLHPKGSA